MYVYSHTGHTHLAQVADVLDTHMMLKMPRRIIASMSKRLDEIEATRARMDADLDSTRALYTEWETK